jgi:hypothetical protein
MGGKLIPPYSWGVRMRTLGVWTARQLMGWGLYFVVAATDVKDEEIFNFSRMNVRIVFFLPSQYGGQ